MWKLIHIIKHQWSTWSDTYQHPQFKLGYLHQYRYCKICNKREDRLVN